MKNLLLVLTLSISVNSLVCQITYHAGMGPMVNDGIVEENVYTQTTFSYCATTGIKYRMNKFNFIFDVEWNLTTWEVEIWEFFTNYYFQTNNLKVIPSIEFKPFKFIGFRIGGYAGLRIKEEVYQGFNFTQFPVELGSNITKPFDYGLTAGADIYFQKKFSVGLYRTIGYYNIGNSTFTNEFGSKISNYSFSNNNTQLVFKFHLPH